MIGLQKNMRIAVGASWLGLMMSGTGCGDAAAPAEGVGLDVQADVAADDAASADVAADDTDSPTEPSLLDFDFMAAGPFSVGYRTVSHTYASPTDGTARTIVIHVWYPLDGVPADDAEHPTYAGLFEDLDSVVDAPLAVPVEAAGYPVHVHSHGHLGFAATSSFLMRHFASHGWVAAAPDHTGNTLFDNIDPRPVAIYALRPADVSATLDALGGLDEGDPLAGRLRLNDVVLSGHSFGAHTCWAAAGATFDNALLEAGCAEAGALGPCSSNELAVFAAGLHEPRVAAIVPMAGTLRRELVGSNGHTTVAVPILALSGSADPVGAEAQYDTTADLDLTWVELAGGCHQTFALGSCDTLDVAEGFEIVNTYTLAFARRHILGDTRAETNALLDGPATLSDKVTLKGVRK